jgi:hypothetical protein
MSWSRWKMMAGVLSVSLGGLATVAGQCPKPDANKGNKFPAEMPISADLPMAPVAPAAPPPGPMPKTPPVPSGPSIPVPAADLPPGPMIPTGPTIPTLGSPALPPVPSIDLPGLPGTPTVPLPPPSMPSTHTKKHEGTIPPPVPQVIPASGPITPPLPTPSVGVIEPPVPGTIPATPPAGLTAPGEGKPLPGPSSGPPPAYGGPPSVPPSTSSIDPPVYYGSSTNPKLTPPVVPASGVSNSTTKFRIVLRVGEGEPTFEVRTGDDLVLKVVCDKVDIKSPEKGSGPSTVKAAGKVHFVGFGAEGTCDELAFLAGTGEVSMTGNVKISVKDKLGRVESELSTESVKYKIDPSAISGSLKP